uniref:hypothetical protein n=1 Tax=Nocardioides alcanivorans TaxID=2897352 RepID=UPI001F160BFB|nr:hypothetical protein [Nocardioides alcanivorans]
MSPMDVSARRRVGGAVVLAVLAGSALTGCQQSEQERRADYCKAIADASATLTRTADEGGAGAFLDALPILEELAQGSPSDLKDEWQTYLTSLRNLRDVLAEIAVDPEELADGVPTRLSKAERQRVRGAVRNVRSVETRQAAQGITQQALDVCDVQIL